jgi:diguanylate cyclase (GGDEF)-like protein
MWDWILKYRLDVTAFAVVSFAAMAASCMLVCRRHGAKLGMWPWLALVGLVGLGAALSEVEGRGTRAHLRHQMEAMAPTYAAELERMGHAQITPQTPPDDPVYLSLIEAQKRWLSLNPLVHDIYTMRGAPDGKVILVVDSETDYDHNGKIEGERERRTAIGEVYEQGDDGLRHALAGEANFDDQPVTDRWGTWVSAWCPMRDSSGRVEAVLGVDFDAATWTWSVCRQRLAALAIMGIPIVGLIIGSGLLTSVRAEAARGAKSEVALLESQRKLQEAATVDRLTGLPNRLVIQEMLVRAVERRAADARHEFALLYLDFDRFKIVNDSLGHGVGDLLLCRIAERLQALAAAENGREACEIRAGRLGGDEFVVLCEGPVALRRAPEVAQRLLLGLEGEYDLQGYRVHTNVSIGLTTSDTGYTRALDVLRDADAAMYKAKAAGGGRWVKFDRAMYTEAADRLRIETDLRGVADRKELLLHYQPIVALSTGELTGFEALVRWRHPERGMISPGLFIPVAEETGTIVPIGNWVLDEACRQLAAWHRQHPSLSHLSMSVNVSRKQLVRTEMAQWVESAVMRAGIRPDRLALEVTESAVIRDVDGAVAVLRQLKALGVSIHLDDFGTGYSSLSCLHKFPIDLVKIDRSFIDGAADRRDYAAVVSAVIAVAHNLGVRLIAEGVETPEQIALLQALDCDRAQGYYFGKPMEAPAALDMALRGRAKAA